jgi:hypothetical protein
MTNLITNINTSASVTNASEKLNNKLCDWVSKVEAGDKDLFAITASKGQMFYVSNRSATALVSFRLLIDKGNGFEMVRDYNKDSASSEISPFTLIVKKDQRLVANDNNSLIVFCVKDVEPTAKAMFVHAQTAYSHLFIAADDKASSVEVFHAVSSSPTSSTDPIAHCMNGIFAHVTAAQGKEVV